MHKLYGTLCAHVQTVACYYCGVDMLTQKNKCTQSLEGVEAYTLKDYVVYPC